MSERFLFFFSVRLVGISFGLVGFVLGYIQQDFRLTFLCLSAGGGISALVRLAR